jgi:integrase
VNRKLIPEKPAKGVPLLKGKKKERFLSAAEILRWAETISTMERDGKLSQNAAMGLRLLLLTGCRKTEIMSLEWPYVDFERRHLRLPDSKTGAKVVPLGAAALEILRDLPRLSSVWVFPASRRSKKGHYDGLQDAWERVRDQANLPGLRLHDLRHSFASIGITDPDTGLFTLSKVLGHREIRSTMRYLHLAEDPLIAAADRTSAWITAAMQGDAGNVVAPDFSAKPRRPKDTGG